MCRPKRSLRKGFLFSGAFFLVGCGFVAAQGESAASPLSGLEELFSLGPVFQDRNGDDVVDFVDAVVVLGEKPSASEVAAAADVAARLGYETMAMDLPVPTLGASGATGILVGSAAVARAELSPAEAGLTGLAAGEGIVRLVSKGSRSWIVAAGSDEAGTRAAAMALAGVLPHVGQPGAQRLEEVLADIESFLSEQDIAVSSAHVVSLEVKAGEEGFERLAAAVELESATTQRQAWRALRRLTPRPASESREEARLSYPGAKVLRVELSAPGARARRVEIPQVAPEKKAGPIPARPGSGAKKKLDLSNLYTNEGFLGDSDKNLIPDRIDVMLSPAGEGVESTVDLAARLGLESTGIQVPIAAVGEDIEDPKKQPTLVLIGGQHPLVKRLVEEEKLDPSSLEPGEGLIQVVPKAFGEKSALVVTGGDPRGVDRALEQVAQRFPHVWERGGDRTSLNDVEMDLWRFFSGRSPAGQAAMALYKLDRIADSLSGKDLESAHVLVSLEKPPPGLEEVVRERAEALGADTVDVAVDNRDVEHAQLIFEDDFAVPSEVDELWRVFRAKVLPKVKRRRPVLVEARVSEPPEIRADIKEQIQAELARKGARPRDMTVRVLSAYKQGYSWLYDEVRPKLTGKSVGEINIRFAKCAPPPEWKQQAMTTPIRWLKEIFPIDEVLAKELGIDLDQIRFEEMPPDSPTYEVVVTDTSGEAILQERFEPKLVLRPYANRFRDYEMVRVTTGWIYATVRGKVVADERIPTDAERFWDHYQEKTLPAVYDVVMERHEGNPRGNGRDAPYFGKLTVELSLSEPNDLIGVDKEVISPMDALHEEIYFSTLLFFRLLGRNARGQELTYVGRVVPIMRPKRDGRAGHAKITFTGFATSRPAVVVHYRERGGAAGSARLDIPKIDMERPSALAAWVRAGLKGLERLRLRVRADTEKDERDELIRRARKEQVDEQILSAEQVRASIENLHGLRSRGMYLDALAYHDLGTLEITVGWKHEVDPKTELVVKLESNGKPAPWPDIRKLLPDNYYYQGEELVQWDTPMPPREAYTVLAKMSTFPEARVYKVGESYLGQDIWAMDLMAPIEASHWSRAKATTFKPTLINSARQHANEVSSTSHVLRWAEMLLTDPEYKKNLQKVNVVVHPVTNADGAQLAYELFKITPEFLLHAGYLGALGMDATSDARKDLPIYPEAKVRPRLWSMWLPDIFLNPHGYPSHQVVQLFSEFDGLVRRGRVTERNWSMNKGWFIPGFGYWDDPELPRHKEAALKIRDYITRAINAAPEVYAMNQRNYDRHRRYGVDFDKEHYKVDMTNDVLIYMPLKGARLQPAGGSRRGYNPRVTYWSGSTEAPDETAHGEWMKLTATAGLQWDKAILQYLLDGHHKVERKTSRFWGGFRLSMNRPRPPKPEKEEKEKAGGVTRQP